MYIKKLDDILSIAKNQTIYYRDKINSYDDFISNNTIKLTKSIIQNNQSDLIIHKYRGELINYLDVTRTSGSTGDFLEVLWNPTDLILSNLCLWRLRNSYYGIMPESKYLTFHSNFYNGNRVIDIKKHMLLNKGKTLSLSKFHLDDNCFLNFISIIEKFSPQWIFTQPSVLRIFMGYMIKYNVNVSKVFKDLKYIELTGEMCLTSLKNQIKTFFNVPVANMYGCNEVNAIAYECPNGHMHVVEDNVYVKVISTASNSKKGEISITSLKNKAMPIIDYALSDNIEIIENINCPYSSEKVINILVGRTYDTVKLHSNQIVSSLDFLYCIEKTNENMGNIIKKYQFIVSKESNTLLLYIEEIHREWSEAIKKEIINYYNEIRKYDHNDFAIEFRYCTNEFNDGSLKDKIFIFKK